MKVFKKSDEDVLDYDFVFTDWLPEGDTVDDAEVIVPEGITYQGKQLFDDRVKVWIGGGTAGNQYAFKLLAHTEGGRTKEINFIIAVTEQ